MSAEQKWWEEFADYTEGMFENAPMCRRVHPTVKSWLNNILNVDPTFLEDGTQLLQVYKEKRGNAPEARVDDTDALVHRFKSFIMLGRSLSGNFDMANDTDVIRQTVFCLSTEAALVDVTDFLNNPLNSSITLLSEFNFGDDGNLLTGLMIIGYAFQKDLEGGMFDDL